MAFEITIIVPCRNAAGTIGRTMSSIYGQSVQPTRVVVVDSMSSDGTSELVQELCKTQPTLVHIREPDSSMTEALNKGLKLVESPIWATINADDEFTAGAFQAVVDKAQQVGDFDLMLGNLIVMKDGMPRYKAVPWPAPWRMSWHLMGCYTNECSSFFSKRAVEKFGGYDENVRYTQDFNLYLRIIGAGKVVHLNKPLSIFHESSSQISAVMRGAMDAEVMSYMQGPLAKLTRRFVGTTPISTLLRVLTGVRSYAGVMKGAVRVAPPPAIAKATS